MSNKISEMWVRQQIVWIFCMCTVFGYYAAGQSSVSIWHFYFYSLDIKFKRGFLKSTFTFYLNSDSGPQIESLL